MYVHVQYLAHYVISHPGLTNSTAATIYCLEQVWLLANGAGHSWGGIILVKVVFDCLISRHRKFVCTQLSTMKDIVSPRDGCSVVSCCTSGH